MEEYNEKILLNNSFQKGSSQLNIIKHFSENYSILYDDDSKKVVAVYFEAYGWHCYADKAITNLDNVSYISLHIYIPIYRDLFSDTMIERYSILTHHLVSNIIYHIGTTGISIENNILKLVGEEKQYFNYFSQEKIIRMIVEQI
ncbi:25444_t:CDS:2 [Dentiscutata erythropus]|uniref:25444_t:CDS:1 n=1 Tax=Dentiscutata erythropus TaxID=1348616 RepID=A0A9N9GLY2_9GLOM|nr:25444_t:CDS:2 [Dentiscutata erythropus]